MPLEASVYPHLIDAIFASAPRVSLLALRGVCREWLARADGLLAIHLTLATNSERYWKFSRLSTPAGRHPALMDFPSVGAGDRFNSGFSLRPSASFFRGVDVLASAQVLDVIGPVPARLFMQLATFLPSGIYVRRAPNRGGRSSLSSPDGRTLWREYIGSELELLDAHFGTHLVQEKERREMYLAYGRPSTVASWGSLHEPRVLSSYYPHAFDPPQRCVRVLEHDGGHGRPIGDFDFCSRPEAEEVVIIFRPTCSQLGQTPQDAYILHGIVGEVASARPGQRHTLVGLETLPCQWWAGVFGEVHGDQNGEEGNEEDGVGGELWRQIRLAARYWIDRIVSDVARREQAFSAAVGCISLFTLEAYRAHLLANPELGERAAELELGKPPQQMT